MIATRYPISAKEWESFLGTDKLPSTGLCATVLALFHNEKLDQVAIDYESSDSGRSSPDFALFYCYSGSLQTLRSSAETQELLQTTTNLPRPMIHQDQQPRTTPIMIMPTP